MKKITFLVIVLICFTSYSVLGQVTAPYTQDFETFTVTNGNLFSAENDWTATNTGTSYFWASLPGTNTPSFGTGPDSSITTGNYFFTESSGSAINDVAELVSPSIDLSPLTTPLLTFDYHMTGDQIGTLDVLVNGTTNVFSLTGEQQTASTDPFIGAIVNLSAFAGQTITVTFRATGNGSFEGDIALDNVSFDEVPTCLEPSLLDATNITETTADLSWTENGTATTWNIEIVDITAGGSQTMTATSTGVTNPYTATGLVQNNDYEFFVQADCGATDGVSEWVGPFAFTTACAAIVAPYTQDFETFTVTNGAAFTLEDCWTATNTGTSYFWASLPGTNTPSFGTGPDSSITTGNYFFTESSGSVIGDVAELVSPSIDLSPLTTPLLTFDYHMTGGQIGTLDVLVNGTTNVFSLTGEQQTASTDPFIGAIVNLSAFAGQTITVTFRATGNGSFEGDIAIDNVFFDEAPPCIEPSFLDATNITATTADLSWTENGTATTWNIEIVDITAGGSQTMTATSTGVTNPYTATGLVQNNDYEFFVQADCGATDGVSEWVGPFNFSTIPSCPEPNMLAVTNITETTADLSWTENGTATTWNIEIVDITAGGSQTMTATATGVANPYTATGLVIDNEYQFFVQADCGATDGVSDWVGPFSFFTRPTVDATLTIDSSTCGVTQATTNAFDASVDNIQWIELIHDGSCGMFTLDTEASTVADTELGLYDDQGNLLFNDDDGGTGLLSLINAGDLPAGTYFIAAGAFNTFFADAFGATSTNTTALGNIVVNVLADTTLSADEFENAPTFTFAPNPVINSLNLTAQNTIQNVTIYNIIGQEVLRVNPNDLQSDIDMTGLQTGTYFARVTINNITQTVKLLKN